MGGPSCFYIHYLVLLYGRRTCAYLALMLGPVWFPLSGMGQIFVEDFEVSPTWPGGGCSWTPTDGGVTGEPTSPGAAHDGFRGLVCTSGERDSEDRITAVWDPASI